jgi:cytochrome bd-type quinol oxidase subunit 1
METTKRKPSIAAIVLALPMLLFGFVMSLFGYFALSEWRSERVALILCGLVWALTSPAVFGSAAWSLVSLGRSPLALRIGGTSILASGIVLAMAAAVGVLPCSSPT